MIATPPRLVEFTAPSKQVMAVLDAAEVVRIRLLLQSATGGEQLARQLRLLAGELQALRTALQDPKLDNRLSSLGSALGLMAEVFRNPGPELARWCNDVLGMPPKRLARHLDVLAEALFLPDEVELSWPAYEPAVLEALLARHLDRERIGRLKRAPLPRRQW
jgi:DNA-binding transcriptional ArsR family regulator